jgi:hypothetical protein
MIYDETHHSWVSDDYVTEIDVRDGDREFVTCAECDQEDYAGFMFDVEDGQGLCESCQHRAAEETRETERQVGRYLDALIHESLRGYP